MMKKCTNLNCDTTFLFQNDRIVCPFCHGILVENLDNEFRQPELIPIDLLPLDTPHQDQNVIPFIKRRFNSIECCGRVVEIDHQTLFNSKKYKLLNSIFRGEPYQLSHQTIEYTIRIENITEEYPTEIMDFCLYGNYLGRLQVGDEVLIKAKNKRDHRVVKSIYNQTTSSAIKSGLQIPAWLIKSFFLILMIAIVSCIYEIVLLFKSGAIVIMAIMPIIIAIFGFFLIIKSLFPKRRR